MGRVVAAVLVAVGFFAYGVLLAGASSTPAHFHVDAAGARQNPKQNNPQFETLRGREGYWRLGRDAAGVWWFVSPEGRAEFLNGVTTVQPTLLGRDPAGPHYVSRDWQNDPRTTSAKDAWAKATLARVNEFGFKGLGAWCDPVFHRHDVPVTRDLNVSTYLVGDERDVFSAKWERRVEQIIRDQVTPLRESRGLVGYYTDNELDWGSGDDEATYRKARRYFEVTTRLVRKYDPNHLVLGVRFRGDAPKAVVRASAGLTDAQSVNYYPHDAKLDRELFETLHRLSGGQPVIVSEYSFHALDGRSGNRNRFGFPAQVADQRARAEGYRNMTSRLARLPYVVGADWFQWMDEPPSGRVRDGEDVNFGVVDVTDREYELLVDAVRETTPKLNGFHGRSASDSYADVWRETDTALAGTAE